MMKIFKDPQSQPVMTGDGSHTLYHPVLKEHYHSLEGSLQESEHIYIGLGLQPKLELLAEGRELKVFEMGFGTGLNALLTWRIADRLKRAIAYTGIEAYPVDQEQAGLLNYGDLIQADAPEILHKSEWGRREALSPYFSFEKINGFLQEYSGGEKYDVVYFDAFSPGSQPELWTPDIFRCIGEMMSEGAYLVTYSSKGSVRRALKEAGFAVEKHPGPGRKREVIRAIRR